MLKRAAFALSIVTASGLPFAACGGDNETIPALDSDSAAPLDAPATDTPSAVDSGGSDSGLLADTGPSDAGPDTPAADVDAGGDTGADAADAGSDSAADAPVDAPAYDGGPLNGCSNNYVDRGGGGQAQRTINVITSGGVFVYDVPCMTIKKGQKVEWDMDFTLHPLAPFGGTTPNPIQLVSSGTQTQVTFPNPGTYGFQCLNHSTMFGAIQVQ